MTEFDDEAIERAYQEYDAISAELDSAWRAVREVTPGSSQHEVIGERIRELTERKIELQALDVDELRERLRGYPTSPEDRETALMSSIAELERMRRDMSDAGPSAFAAAALDGTLARLRTRLEVLQADRPSPN